MNTTTDTPTKLGVILAVQEALPAIAAKLGARVTTDHDGDGYTPAIILDSEGWWADTGEGGGEIQDLSAATRQEAADAYVDWVDEDHTVWVTVYTWRTGLIMDDDGEWVEVQCERESVTVTVHPDAPECRDGHEHDWRSPHRVVGGLPENPGVWGHGGGVIIREVCRHCGQYRVTNTWAQSPATGEEGLTSIRYEPADDDSLEWMAGLDCDD